MPKIDLTDEEIGFLAAGIQSINLKGTATDLLPTLTLIASIHQKCREALIPPVVEKPPRKKKRKNKA